MTSPDEPGARWSAQQFEDRLHDIGQQWRALLRSAPPPAEIPVDVRAALQEKLYDLSASLMNESLEAVTVEGEHDLPAGSIQVTQEVVARFLLRDVSVDGVEVIDRWLVAALEADAAVADTVVELVVSGEEEGGADDPPPTGRLGGAVQQEPDMDPYQRDLVLSASGLVDELHRHAAFMSRWSSGDEELEQANRALRRSFQEYDDTVSERTDGLLELWRPVEDDDDNSLADPTDEIVLESGTTIAVISRYDYVVDELPRTADALIGEVPVGGIQLTILPTEKLPVDDALAWPPDEADERAWLMPDGELLRGDIFIPVPPPE